MEPNTTKTITIIVVLVALVLAGAMYARSRQMSDRDSILPPNDEEGVFCTMDAKQCPDGSYVGRIGPNCEFAPCPQ